MLIVMKVKDPFKTSQFCSTCNRWDRRNRKGDRFKCVHCGYQSHADHNAAHNLELLGTAGVYGLRSYLSSKRQSFG
ncbi:MAG: transposase [Scytonema sp. CRU_2_7]|nr:transposase [Scytonema sp. CRU_2_7]